jgi:hypothetical protein
MDWLKLPTSFRDNASRLEAQYRGGAAAIVLYVDCYLWAAQHETDGILPAAVVASLVAGIDDEAWLRSSLPDCGSRPKTAACTSSDSSPSRSLAPRSSRPASMHVTVRRRNGGHTETSRVSHT